MSGDAENLIKSGYALPLVEEFYTLQGEGYHTGKAAYFIRLGGCDICCEWCDTKFSWNASVHPLVNTNEIVNNALKYKAKSVVVTGGEPTQYNLSVLCKGLKKEGLLTYLETAGIYPLTGKWDWICLSPKKHNPPLNQYFKKADELKVVIRDETDFDYAIKNAMKVTRKCQLFLQPEWSRYHAIIQTIVAFIKDNPSWRISLQSHKFMNIP